MLHDVRTLRDEEYGTVGIALRVRDQWTGCLMWLWSPKGCEFKEDPTVPAYQVESVADDPITWELWRTIHRLLAAGVITPAERVMILARLWSEQREVAEYWSKQGLPVPRIEDIMRAEGQQ